jgi:hypothetical protein
MRLYVLGAPVCERSRLTPLLLLFFLCNFLLGRRRRLLLTSAQAYILPATRFIMEVWLVPTHPGRELVVDSALL